MATIRLPMEITQGAEFRRRFRAYGDLEKTEPIDFTGFAMQFMCRRRQWLDAPEIFRATISDGRIVSGGTEGYFDVIVPADATVDFPDGDFYYWLTLWPDEENEKTTCWLRGPLKILPGVPLA